jgi:hypothetical protein
MSLPSVLIIGAMKAGTTSLYMDIVDRAGGFLAQDKEPHALCSDDVLTPEGLAAYQSLYAKAQPGALCCDASTGYAKRPDFEKVAERASRTLPGDYKAIYIVRHPIDRIVSQHHHEHTAGLVGPSIDEEVRRHARYIQYSRYAYQLDPWLAELGPERLHVVLFEDYASRRRAVVSEVLRFLGLPDQSEAADDAPIYNKSRGKPVKGKLWQAIRYSTVYRRLLRPLAPPKLRIALQRMILPKATAELAPLAAETRTYLQEALREDVAALEKFIGRPTGWEGFGQEEGHAARAGVSDSIENQTTH